MAGISLYEGHKYKLVEDNPEHWRKAAQDDSDTLGIVKALFSGVRWCYYVDLTTGHRVPDENGNDVVQPLMEDGIQALLDDGTIESFEPFLPNNKDDD